MKSRPCLATLILALGAVATSSADIINVPGDYSTIQAAIVNSSNGDEIVVAPGTYNEVIDLNGRQITLRSSAGPEATMINGTGFGDNVVTCNSTEGVDTILRGFTITGGNAVEGGGMFMAGSCAATVDDCIFDGNFAENRGGGILNVGTGTTIQTISNCVFSGNSSRDGAGLWTGRTAIIRNCTFSGNTTFNSGDGAGIWGTDATVSGCVFIGNTASGTGGGVFLSEATVVNSLFVDNLGGGVRGSSYSKFINCVIVGNDGGGMDNVNNVTVTNCIAWDNSPAQITGGIVTFGNVQGGFMGQGNIDTDPLFVDPLNGDYRLSVGSPCIDAGNSMAYFGPIIDFAGNARGVNDPATSDTGVAHPGSTIVIDMGAFEFQAASPDLNEDGSVNAADLALLLGAWGP